MNVSMACRISEETSGFPRDTSPITRSFLNCSGCKYKLNFFIRDTAGVRPHMDVCGYGCIYTLMG